MTLFEFMLKNYREDPYFVKFTQSFPKMWMFSKEVEVIPWDDSYAIADRNTEVLDKIERLNKEFEMKLISPEEYRRKKEEITKELNGNIIVKTLGVAFRENKQVSFREEKPHLHIAIHELGHIYFDVGDKVWSAKYGGGEMLLWFILEGLISFEDNEKAVRKYMEIFSLPEEELLDKLEASSMNVVKEIGGVSKKVMNKIRMMFYGEEDILEKYQNTLYLCYLIGYIPNVKFPHLILVNLIYHLRDIAFAEVSKRFLKAVIF